MKYVIVLLFPILFLLTAWYVRFGVPAFISVPGIYARHETSVARETADTLVVQRGSGDLYLFTRRYMVLNFHKYPCKPREKIQQFLSRFEAESWDLAGLFGGWQTFGQSHGGNLLIDGSVYRPVN